MPPRITFSSSGLFRNLSRIPRSWIPRSPGATRPPGAIRPSGITVAAAAATVAATAAAVVITSAGVTGVTTRQPEFTGATAASVTAATTVSNGPALDDRHYAGPASPEAAGRPAPAVASASAFASATYGLMVHPAGMDQAGHHQAGHGQARARQSASRRAGGKPQRPGASRSRDAGRHDHACRSSRLHRWICRAESIMMEHGTPKWAVNSGAAFIVVLHESGGNPHARNNWDSNAAAGTPSEGIAQVTRLTFTAYALPGRGNIWNPVDNMIAAFRYAVARYGSMNDIPGVVSVRRGGAYAGF